MHTVTLYHRHRFPAEIISHCVWLYFRFPLSFRDVEEMLAKRGVVLTLEAILTPQSRGAHTLEEEDKLIAVRL
jgi:transposase-like protein